ncbi:hypothetical protein QE152_g24772 [Popillia japonica]|uniref:Uncharacterized protein n=1 Tax=Popillia japonica TaxID=7064 RepID=A0AAW1K2C8_POPJA
MPILAKDDPCSAYETAKSQSPASAPQRDPREGGEKVHNPFRTEANLLTIPQGTAFCGPQRMYLKFETAENTS